MNTMEEYLNQLKAAFAEEDMEDFEELKEDLLEQLAICLEEGQTEAEVVARLAPPEEIAADYYADLSLDAAINAKTSVVPREEIQDVFIQTQKKRMRKFLKTVFMMLKPLLFLVLLGLFGFFLVYTIKELSGERNLAGIPTILCLLLSALILQLIKGGIVKKRKLINGLTIGLLAFGTMMLLFFSATGQLMYTGRQYYKEISLTSSNHAAFSFDSDADVEITTVEVSSTEKPSLMVKGRFKESDIKKIENGSHDNKINLSLDKENIFDTFTRTGRSEVIFFIPKGTILDDFHLGLSRGDLRLLDIQTKNFDLDLIAGDVYAKNIIADEGNIDSESGDVIIEESAMNLKVNSISGKTVITGMLGDLTIEGNKGLSILKFLRSDNVALNNYSGRMILEDSEIKKLKATATDGQVIVKRTKGDILLSNENGKIVSEENLGTLELENGSGPTIAIQESKVNAKVSSQSGFIKWLQDPSQSVKVTASTGTGELRNDFSDVTDSGKYKIDVKSKTGDVKILEKVE
ncbi:hypothetical protein UAW_02451 [Enterococcus haemoperoxidus ATCC BAA-382]|uniref:DUF4097 domain-containing protein n=2 Tax=Enterococcus TaxID=1350 RepID=R2SF87_9ENTE|nr:hypothetical protein UAW_02451 [Enterococcus haemoperoxidus ATCC BAA-382]EOT63338.1 hypothetical protein I583_00138 [Enterococcus haemoperoxidus ATCC BAA-382]